VSTIYPAATTATKETNETIVSIKNKLILRISGLLITVLFRGFKVNPEENNVSTSRNIAADCFTKATVAYQPTLLPPASHCIVKVIEMDKTKTMVLAATFAVLAVIAVVGAVYAQSVSNQTSAPAQSGYSQVPQTQSSAGTNGAYGYGSYTCPRNGGTYAYSAPQSGYSYGMGMRGGIMGGYYR
jgi:hypothetical protein